MISAKRLLTMARKWQKLVAGKQRRISLPRSVKVPLMVAKQGHFVVYTVDKKRHEFPLKYLRSNIFVQLFWNSEVAFGLPTHGPITLPCESFFLEYVVSFVKEAHVGEDLEKALLISMCPCNSSSLFFHVNGQSCSPNIPILGF